jgi:hypothetical protein
LQTTSWLYLMFILIWLLCFLTVTTVSLYYACISSILFHTDYCMIGLLFLLLLCAGTGSKPWHVYCVYSLSLLCRTHNCLGHNPIVLYSLLLSLGLLLYMHPYCILCINTGPCTSKDISSLWLCPSLHSSSHILLHHDQIQWCCSSILLPLEKLR